MIKSKWIGSALGLALCVALSPACSKVENSSQSTSNAAAPAPSVQVQWNGKLKKQLREIIANAPANGLKPELFLKADTEDEATLTQAALKYAEALTQGYSDPSKIYPVYTLPRPSADVRQAFLQAMKSGDLVSWFASLPPQTDEYKALSQAHLKYLKLAASSNFQPVASGKPLNPGSRDDRVAALAAALSAMGYLGAQPQQSDPHNSPTSARFSPQLVAAVKKLQSDFGLKTDGIVGGDTLAAINMGPAGLARECAIAMERLRWLERDPPQTRIDVNTAATFLDYWRDGQHMDRREVVAGEPDKQTPQIEAPIVNLVAYPKWRVPDSIADKEVATKSRGWLQENNFANENGHWVQQSGPKNSLGIVKFDMDDKQQIYLHDTPAKALFGLPERHRSHGCVRVQGAVAFAHAIATEEGVDDQFQKAMAGQQEAYVKLKSSIPVRLLYHTAFWDGSRLQFRPDIYGLDDDVAAALGLVRGVSWQAVQQSNDIGP
ncbi:MAG TPA: L,D-transpeptidase family protein [Sphingomicrobium sp.]|nr:L,D-transpeptidase family protein [Sphingomicrobium sp.]